LAQPVSVCIVCSSEFALEGHVRWTKDGHDIVRCPSCGLLFRRDLPTQAELAEIYGLEYFKGGAARGWDASGIDVSEPMVDWGKRTLSAPLERTTLATSGLPAASLDALTMWDYIEHSIDPVGDLERAHELLRPGGVLALSTGDAATLVARLSGSRWHLLTPRHHNFFFTAATLSRLLARSGFAVVTLDHRGSRYPLRYLVHKLRTLVPLGALDTLTGRLAHGRLGAVALPVNLWDIVTVVARRAPK
jgi:hypothetical protein